MLIYNQFKGTSYLDGVNIQRTKPHIIFLIWKEINTMENMMAFAKALKEQRAYDFIAQNINDMSSEDLKDIIFRLMDEITNEEYPNLNNVAADIEWDYDI